MKFERPEIIFVCEKKNPVHYNSEAVREFNLKNTNKFVDIKKIILYLHK